MRRLLVGIWVVGAALALAAGCTDPLDVIGVNQSVTKKTQQQGTTSIADDNIKDKHPVFVPGFTITESFAGPVGPCKVTLNKSGSVTKLDVLPWGKSDSALKDHIFPNRPEALVAIGNHAVLPSMEIINGALKPFDDGLYAAVELAAEDGSDGSAINKAALFKNLLAELVTRASSGTATEQPLASEAAAQIGAAILAGGGSPALPPAIAADAQKRLAGFNADLQASTPIGFYTWNKELEGIFRRDRFLQRVDVAGAFNGFGAFAETAVALNGAPAIASQYGTVLDLYSGLTDPFFDLPPTAVAPLVPDASALANLSSIRSTFYGQHPELVGTPDCAARLAFVPASDSVDKKLFRDLSCSGSLAANQNLIDVLIDQIRSGKLDLTPKPNSGWYDRQIYALETLLVPEKAPEKDHLFLTRRYKEKLVETFKSLITQHRETHVKQLGSVGKGHSVEEPPVDLYPQLPVEPFPTFYLRTARGYRFLQGVLLASMGQTFLDQSSRVIEDGTRSKLSLGAELSQKIDLLYGLYSVAARSIGMKPVLDKDESDVDLVKDEAFARNWIDNWRADPDIARDPRVIVPVGASPDGSGIIYWAVLGVKVIHIQAQFYPGYEPEVVSSGCNIGKFIATEPYTLVEQQVEIKLSDNTPPPTRDKLRAIADKYDNEADIVKALESL